MDVVDWEAFRLMVILDSSDALNDSYQEVVDVVD
jgi:hypothetical protein